MDFISSCIFLTFSWNDFYKREIRNFSSNEEDVGECWFDDSDAERKVTDFFCSLILEGDLALKLKIVDLGTGNGHFLFELFDTLIEEDVECETDLHGIDYSPDSVEFAKQIAHTKYPDQKFTFEEVDFIAAPCAYIEQHAQEFDVIFDKGTLDAIALNNDPVVGFGNKIGTQVYPIQVQKLMKSGSILIITSCNFTQDELVKVVTENGTNSLEVWKHVEYPSFQFGGVKGSTISSIVFRKA